MENLLNKNYFKSAINNTKIQIVRPFARKVGMNKQHLIFYVLFVDGRFSGERPPPNFNFMVIEL